MHLVLANARRSLLHTTPSVVRVSRTDENLTVGERTPVMPRLPPCESDHVGVVPRDVGKSAIRGVAAIKLPCTASVVMRRTHPEAT